MFDPNSPAYPTQNPYLAESGFTKFEEAAKDFTAAWIVALSARWKEQGYEDRAANNEAARLGVDAAKAFVWQMEEREKDGSKGN